MGADIHSYVERYDEDQNEWVQLRGFQSSYYKKGDWYFGGIEYSCSDELINSRNYDLFSLLANVRNYGDKIKPIKPCEYAVPDDVSTDILECYFGWGADAHSASWYTAKELNDYLNDYDNVLYLDKIGLSKNWLFLNGLPQMNERSKKDGSDVRLVFWFDN